MASLPPSLVGVNEAFTRGMFEQLIHRAGHAFAIDRVAIEIADDDELGVGRQAARFAGIVVQVVAFLAVDVIGDQADFVVVAAAVAVFGAIEHGRRRVRAEQVQRERLGFCREPAR